MAGEPRPWPPPASLDTPRRRLRRAERREFALLLPWLAAVVAATVWFGRWAGIALLVAVVGLHVTRLTVTGTSPALRRVGVRYVRLGTGAPPERWRLVLFRVGPPALLLPVAAVSQTGSNLVYVVLAGYVAFWVAAYWRTRRHGPDLDPMMALAGLDVWWDGDAPTASGTTGPPAPAPPPPTPPAPATPAPAPTPGRPAHP